MISEKERINALKDKIIQYENELDEKNSIIVQYQTVEKAADSFPLFFIIYLKFLNRQNKGIKYHTCRKGKILNEFHISSKKRNNVFKKS